MEPAGHSFARPGYWRSSGWRFRGAGRRRAWQQRQQRFGDLGDRTQRQHSNDQQAKTRKAPSQLLDEDLRGYIIRWNAPDTRPVKFHCASFAVINSDVVRIRAIRQAMQEQGLRRADQKDAAKHRGYINLWLFIAAHPAEHRPHSLRLASCSRVPPLFRGSLLRIWLFEAEQRRGRLRLCGVTAIRGRMMLPW
jgi:hypothetical protein